MYIQNIKKKIIFFRKIKKILKKNSFSYSLFNRTLLCAKTLSLLSYDKYDDIVVDIKILNKDKLIKELKKNFNFKIRSNYLQVFYDNFIINIYLVDFNQKFLNFNGFKVDTYCFKKVKKIKIMKTIFNVPSDSKYILKKIFLPNNFEIILSSLFQIDKSLIIRVKNFLIAILYIIIFQKRYNSYELNFRILSLFNLSFSNFINAGLNKFKRKKIYKLNFSKFKKLYFDPLEHNWFIRKKHYSLIIKNNKKMRIQDIINFLKIKKIKNLKNKIIETKINSILEEPIHLNQIFWNKGNNFFIYAIIYGFKKGVIGYEKINEYIKLKKKPKIFTKKYFENLEDMNAIEIKKYLKDNPIPINKLGFSGGRHRVAAMIGRVLKGEKYIPFYVYKI